MTLDEARAEIRRAMESERQMARTSESQVVRDLAAGSAAGLAEALEILSRVRA